MAKTIMIQGTMSNVGKSLITAGLCRIFRQDGYRTAPFKSQNMALNSFITGEGLEIGRAQAMQAEAAGVEPLASMNPILLKPSSDMGSQVIVRGLPVGHMEAGRYFTYKKNLSPIVENAFRELESQFDIVVIEGAGSPAEINLKQNDIVNMGMARMAKAPVLLAGDIDRGGVFAQLYGTVLLLEPEERTYVKGLLVNKFRGDLSLLKPGLSAIEELCGIPVMGVIPYLDVDLEDEDSLCARLENRKKGSEGMVDIAVIHLPRISNFTDFSVFSCFSEVSVRYVKKTSDLGRPDLILLPGTKNTIEDLTWLRESGLEAAVLKLVQAEVPIFGICGGYQMLGESLRDDSGADSGAAREIRGMGLLPVETYFTEEKARSRAIGTINEIGGVFKSLSGLRVEGYEIHMGRTGGSETYISRITAKCGESRSCHGDGCFRENVYGTYLHGFFDGEGVARTVVSALMRRKGFSKSAKQPQLYKEYRESQYDLLAEGLRSSLDMSEIYRILDRGL